MNESMKYLPIESFDEGYSVTNMDCINLPIAIASSLFNHDNYYFYCFFNAVYSNWYGTNKTFFELINEILHKFGLSIKTYTVKEDKDFIPFIRSCIDGNKPVFLVLTRKSLIYSPWYSSDHPEAFFSHGLLVTGYDPRQSILKLGDSEIVERSGAKYLGSGYGLFTLYLKEDLVLEMWKNTNKIGHCLFPDQIAYIEKNEAPSIATYKDLFSDFVKGIPEHKNLFHSLLSDCDSTVIDENRLWGVWQNYHGKMVIIFDVIEKCLLEMRIYHRMMQEFNILKEDYIKNRYLLIAKLYSNAIRKRHLSIIEKDAILEQILSYDNTLYVFLRKASDLGKASETQLDSTVEIVDLSADSIIAADSTLDSECMAANAIDGKITTFWRSNFDANIHWLLIDLGSKKTVVKFIITHSSLPNEITRDFMIQGSNDMNKWDELANIANNRTYKNTFDISPVCYRYIRLYITYPSDSYLGTKINRFRVYGYS